MNYRRYQIYLIISLVFFSQLLSAQLSESQIDSLNHEIFPLYTNIYTFNSKSMFQIPDGEYTLIYTTAAGHHTDSTNMFMVAVTDQSYVSPDQQAIAEGDPKRHLWVYDREQFIDDSQFADSLHALLSEYFTISSFDTYVETEVKIYPNPAKNHIYVQIPNLHCKAQRILIINVQGIIVLTKDITKTPGDIKMPVNIEQLPPGHYWLGVENCNNSHICEAFLKL